STALSADRDNSAKSRFSTDQCLSPVPFNERKCPSGRCLRGLGAKILTEGTGWRSKVDSNRRCREKPLRRKSRASIGEISRRSPLASSRERVRFQFGTLPGMNLEFRCRENAAEL